MENNEGESWPVNENTIEPDRQSTAEEMLMASRISRDFLALLEKDSFLRAVENGDVTLTQSDVGFEIKNNAGELLLYINLQGTKDVIGDRKKTEQ